MTAVKILILKKTPLTCTENVHGQLFSNEYLVPFVEWNPERKKCCTFFQFHDDILMVLKKMSKKIDDLVEGEDFYSDMYNLLGTEDPDFGLKQVKEKVKGLLEGGYIKTFNDMDLWQLFSTAGLLNRNSKFASVFDKLPSMPRTQKEIDALTKWVNDPNDQSVPLGGGVYPEGETAGEEKIASGGAGETGDSTENNNPLDYQDSEHGKYNLENTNQHFQ